MRNVMSAVVPPHTFHLSVRALGGWFHSEVEAQVTPQPGGTLLLWRQAYPLGNLMSRMTVGFLGGREAAETRKVLALWSGSAQA
jgi:hypothetical protein